MNEFMYLLPFFTLCEDSLQLFNQVIDSYGLTVACCLLWVGIMLLLMSSGLTSLADMTKAWRAHKENLLPYYADIEYREARYEASFNVKDTYRNCPIRLSRIGLEIEMRFGATLNWDHANMDLLVGSTKAKKKARKALLGEDWSSFVTAVPAGERTNLYKAAVSLQKAFLKLESDKLKEHQALVAPMGFAVTSVRWNRESQSWSFSYGCKVVKKSEVA